VRSGAAEIPLMSIDTVAAVDPSRAATIRSPHGSVLSFGALHQRSIQIARMLRRLGLLPGDRVAILLDNVTDYHAVTWGVRRAELRYVPINWHLGSGEARYLVEDCDARALIASSALADLATGIAASLPRSLLRIACGSAFEAFRLIDVLIESESTEPPAAERDGVYMFYSSGTTGRPKGILRPLPGEPFGTMRPLEQLVGPLYGFRDGMVYFNPAPLYHAAPLGWTMAAHMHGGTAIISEKFDAEKALKTIERHRVTHAHFVPTHFARMLKLPPEVRRRYDMSNLEVVLHAAAPCPIPIKEAMIDWWGPIIHEFYSGSEGGGFTTISSAEWLAHKGSVGRSIGNRIHIVDADGTVLPAGETGAVYFEGAEPFVYHKDEPKTAEFFNERGWGTLGDIGRLDTEGYLYLTDRSSHMIITGGVNVYPQEVEDLLIAHPKVSDAAVIGVPHPEMGEEVKAVIVPSPTVAADAALATELLESCRASFAAFKCPRSIDFVAELPRLPTGKLLKRALRKRYWTGQTLI
jgi:long-chain acyl-CoA synthetase